MRGLVCALFLLATLNAGGAEGVPWTVRVDIQVAAIETKVAVTLLPALQRVETSEAAIKKVQSLIKSGHAELRSWLTAYAVNGGRGSTMGGEELRSPDYSRWRGVVGPQNFDPPLGPQIPTYRFPASVGQHWGNYVPTGFENRPLGPNLEFQPFTSDGVHISLELATSHTEFIRFLEFKGTAVLGKITGVIVQPQLRSRTYRGTVTVQHGKRVLLTSCVENEPDPKVILYLLRARASH